MINVRTWQAIWAFLIQCLCGARGMHKTGYGKLKSWNHVSQFVFDLWDFSLVWEFKMFLALTSLSDAAIRSRFRSSFSDKMKPWLKLSSDQDFKSWPDICESPCWANDQLSFRLKFTILSYHVTKMLSSNVCWRRTILPPKNSKTWTPIVAIYQRGPSSMKYLRSCKARSRPI